MNKKPTNNKPGSLWQNRSIAFVVIVFLGLLAGFRPAAGKDLNLSTIPLFTGSNVKPNVLVAVDDSGSMDFETVFSANDGILHWSNNSQSFLNNDGDFRDDGTSYGYLFPRGDAYYSHPDRRVRGDGKAVPPIPQMAFSRSPDYNKAYFNPTSAYEPWTDTPEHNFEDIEWTSAPSDPLIGSDRINLMESRFGNDSRERFLLSNGMVLPKNTKYQVVNYDSDTSGNGGVNETNNDIKVGRDYYLILEYYPATFYLKSPNELPPGYGYNKEPLTGYAPATPGNDYGQRLYGYEIKPDNFDSSTQFKAAIQNFANWFTYYRKRHLATRGGIVSAFDQISGIKSGQCTINEGAKYNASDLTLRDLDKDDDRNAFYNSIFDIDYTVARGTPNRKALQFLGSQLETNQSIINYPCQQNFAILFTDGFNNDGVKSSVGNTDGNNGPPFADGYSNTIADVAIHYYEGLGDLVGRTNPNDGDYVPRNQIRRPAGCDDTNPDKSLDCEKDLHMITYGVTLGQKGMIFNGKNKNPYDNPPSWPNPTTGSYGIEQIDDLWHATINGHGELLNASTPQEIADKFAAALEKILNIAGAASGIAANGRRQASDSRLYQATFIGGVWRGELSAYPLGSDVDTATPDWTAGNQLTERSSDDRDILTSILQNGDYKGVAFDNSLANSRNDISAAEIQYIRGDQSGERRNGGAFRNRGSNILGDIVHSTPLYVGAPNGTRFPAPGDWTDLLNSTASAPENSVQPYFEPGNTQAFAQQNTSREPMVYVGANDGMLHGFSASDGAEKIAYVPNLLIPSLRDLTQTDYVHRYYVDGSPVQGDVVFDGEWHTVLVSGLANGGNGVFALDVTNPGDFSEDNAQNTALWEFTDTELGKTYGQPSIVRLHNGQWAAMVANGYNSNNGGGSASLFLLDIQTGKPIGGKPIDTGVGATNENEDVSNGLSEPFPVDLDGDFITDYAYAGDLYGNVWRFDLTSTNPNDWSATKLFTAKDKNGNAQPITTQPQVAFHPYGQDYGVMVYFGTGKYLEENDAAVDKSLLNSLYGIWDRDVFIADVDNKYSYGEVSRDRLVRQTVRDEVTPDEATYRILSKNAVSYQLDEPNTTDLGWVLDLPAEIGELIIDSPRIEDGTLRVSTTIPTVQSCAAGGSGFFMRIDLATGGRTSEPTFDVDRDLKFTNEGDRIESSEGKVNVSGVMIAQAAPGGSLSVRGDASASDYVALSNGAFINLPAPSDVDRRRSWREIRR